MAILKTGRGTLGAALMLPLVSVFFASLVLTL